jgi:glucosamine-6-phosphate deaminase
VELHIGTTAEEVGRLAAEKAAGTLRAAVAERGVARVLFASAPSQQHLLDRLAEDTLPWRQIHAFHVDEYIGIDPAAPQSFGNWLSTRLFDRVPIKPELIDPRRDGDAEAARYGALLREAPIDLALLGIGVNGHLAFNEPYQWLIDDPQPLRCVVLDEESRRQQVDDGCFDTLVAVPTSALTVTVPLLLSSATIIVSVVGAQKARAVAGTLAPGIKPSVPASALQTHPDVTLYLDPPAFSEARVQDSIAQ